MSRSTARDNEKKILEKRKNTAGKKYKHSTKMHSVFDLQDGEVRMFRYERGGDVWQFRMYIKEEQRYIFKSTQERDKDRAVEKAKEMFFRYKARELDGQKLFSPSAKKLTEEYLKYQQNRKDSKQISQGRLSGIKTQLKQYLQFVSDYSKAYGENIRIANIDGKYFRKYQLWRQSKKNGAKRLSTVLNELLTFKHMYEWGKREGFVAQKYKFDYDEIRIPSDECKRDGYEIEEYKQLTNTSKNWYKKVNKKDNKFNEKTYYRRLLHDFLLIMGRCGFRTSECMKLRWEDIKIRNDKEQTASITIRKENTKVRKERTVTLAVGNIFKRIKTYSKFTNYSDYVFAHYEIKDANIKYKIYDYYKELKDEVKTKYEHFDTSLDIYGIRHFFITLHLKVAKTDMYSIARLCGTSIKEIEKTYSHIKDDEVSRSVMKSSKAIRFGKDGDILLIEEGKEGSKSVRNLYD